MNFITPAVAAADAVTEPHLWPRILARYRDPSLVRSIVEIAITAFPLIALWAAMWASLQVSYWLSLAFVIPAAGFLVRLFMIQHDCSHDAFFRTRASNAWVGRVISVFTLTPHDHWRHTHALHHATSGNLDRRGIGDVLTHDGRRIFASCRGIDGSDIRPIGPLRSCLSSVRRGCSCSASACPSAGCARAGDPG